MYSWHCCNLFLCLCDCLFSSELNYSLCHLGGSVFNADDCDRLCDDFGPEVHG